MQANVVTELLPDSKLKHTRYLDECHAIHGEPLGTLYGVPISVKKHIGMNGLRLDACMHSVNVLQVLQRAGVVFHAHTTQP